MRLKRTHWLIVAVPRDRHWRSCRVRDAPQRSRRVFRRQGEARRHPRRRGRDRRPSTRCARCRSARRCRAPIAKLNVDFNSRVHKGDVVALIDPSLLQGALQQAVADLESAQANLTAAEANVDRTRATAGADQRRLRARRDARGRAPGNAAGARPGALQLRRRQAASVAARRRERRAGQGAGQAEGCGGRDCADQRRLHGHPLADRRDRRRAQRRCRTDRRGLTAGADDLHDRAGPHADAALRQGGRVGRRPHQGRGTGDIQGRCVSEGDISRRR